MDSIAGPADTLSIGDRIAFFKDDGVAVIDHGVIVAVRETVYGQIYVKIDWDDGSDGSHEWAWLNPLLKRVTL